MSEVLERLNGRVSYAAPSYQSDIVITAVPHEFLADEFIRTGALMERVAKSTRGRFQVEDLFEACCEGRMTLWVVARILSGRKREYLGVLFTSITEYPRKRAMRMNYMSGIKLTQWISQFATAIQHAARAEGCDLLEGGGRLGWDRVLRRWGPKPIGYYYELEVGDA